MQGVGVGHVCAAPSIVPNIRVNPTMAVVSLEVDTTVAIPSGWRMWRHR